MKKRQWKVRRHHMEQSDAHYRWDRSYQSLLYWSALALPGSALKAAFAGEYQ